MRKPKLLVVDDEEALCQFIQKAAKAIGYEVKITTSAEEFLRAFDDDPPDIVMMDIIMPDMDGIELLQHLGDRHCTAAIFVITGFEDLYLEMAGKLGHAKNLNIVDFFTKPLRLSVLSGALKKVSLGKFATA